MDLQPCPYRQVDDEGQILCDKIKTGDRAVSPTVCRACPVATINCAHLRATLNQQTRPPIVVRFGNGKTQIWDDMAPPLALGRAACALKVTPIHSPQDCAGCLLRQALVAPEAIATVPDLPAMAPDHSATVPAQVVRSRGPARRRTPDPVVISPTAAPYFPAAVTVTQTAAAHKTAPTAAAIVEGAMKADHTRTMPAPPNGAGVAEERRAKAAVRKVIRLDAWLERRQSAVPSPTAEEPMPARARGDVRAVQAQAPQGEEKCVGWTD